MKSAPIRFRADRATYFHSHTRQAAIAMGAAMALLWLFGNPNIWVGAAAGLGAIAIRGFWLRNRELATVWELREGHLVGPGGVRVPLSDIYRLRSLGSFVQVITTTGDTFLIKYQADAKATIAAIRRAMAADNRGKSNA